MNTRPFPWTGATMHDTDRDIVQRRGYDVLERENGALKSRILLLEQKVQKLEAMNQRYQRALER